MAETGGTVVVYKGPSRRSGKGAGGCVNVDAWKTVRRLLRESTKCVHAAINRGTSSLCAIDHDWPALCLSYQRHTWRGLRVAGASGRVRHPSLPPPPRAGPESWGPTRGYQTHFRAVRTYGVGQGVPLGVFFCPYAYWDV